MCQRRGVRIATGPLTPTDADVILSQMLGAIDWEKFTAIGTLALATVTAGLAWTTRQLAKAATGEAQANWRPVLMIAPNRLDPSEGVEIEDGDLSISVTNVGRGPALRVHGTLWEEDDPAAVWRSKSKSDVVAANGRLELTWPAFKIPARNPDFGLPLFWRPVRGEFIYGDVTYGLYVTTFTISFRIDAGGVELSTQEHKAGRQPPVSVRLTWTALKLTAYVQAWRARRDANRRRR